MKFKFSFLFFFLFYLSFYGQLVTTVRGDVLDKNDGSVVNTAIVTVLSSSETIPVNEYGEFFLESWQSPPLKIKVSSIGYKDYYYTITSNKEQLTVILEEGVTSLNEVIVSASRTTEKLSESPVSVEVLSAEEIENTTAATFYDGLGNLKGVNVNTSSLGFKSVNTRGFASFGNNRFVQLVDGVDNASPSLNFSIGNTVGVNELDIESIELLPGASSALYGANAFNGILFMKSKNPFDNEGLSVYGKSGYTNADNVNMHQFYDLGFRVAKNLNDKVALKLTGSYFKATDWLASDYSNVKTGKIVEGDRDLLNYNGLNVYGDELGLDRSGLTRTGYEELDLVDLKTDSFKASFSAHFRPFSNDENTEIIYTSKFGISNTIHHDTRRVALRNFARHQHRLELKSKHLMVRTYGNFEDAGDSYDIGFAGQNILKDSHQDWYINYQTAIAVGMAPKDARTSADTAYRLDPSSDLFKRKFEEVVSESDFSKGAKFTSNSRYYHTDINYNFKDLIDFAELQIGGSYRGYLLDSDGQIFTDYDDKPIIHHEYGLYTQLQKKVLYEKLKLTASFRFDKSDGFDGNISPRISALYSLDEDNKHNIRASFQTGFRNPTVQEQYLGVYLGEGVGLGSAKGNPERYTRDVQVAGKTFTFEGEQAYNNSYTEDLSAKSDLDYIKPEGVRTTELGYRGKLKSNLSLDISGYYSRYSNLIANTIVVVPLGGSASDMTGMMSLMRGEFLPVSLAVNTTESVDSYGGNFGVKSQFNGYDLGISYTYTKLNFENSKAASFETNFNTPEHKVKLSFGNVNVYKQIGFGVNARWQDAFYWESNFVDGYISARTIVDAQVSYQIEELKSKIKFGGSNILGNDYFSAPGTGRVGSQVYVSWNSLF